MKGAVANSGSDSSLLILSSNGHGSAAINSGVVATW